MSLESTQISKHQQEIIKFSILFFKKFHFLKFHMYECFFECLKAPSTWSAVEAKRELLIVMRCHVGARDWIQVLWVLLSIELFL